jgi:hypothetical protein
LSQPDHSEVLGFVISLFFFVSKVKGKNRREKQTANQQLFREQPDLQINHKERKVL